jgi:diguanylate cyclase (GGDEF)-like protein/PAS domain S-box-containing protein
MRVVRTQENPMGRPDHWEQVLEVVPAAVLLVDSGGAIVYANEEASLLTGYPRGELTSCGVEDLVPEARRSVHARWRTGWREERRPMGTGLDIMCRRADGTTFSADVSLAPITLDGVTYVVATLRDETERRRSEDELLKRALHDPLTGLPNRVLFLDRLDHALERRGREYHPVAVLYVDLDGFKTVNDTWGHAAGDEVLQVVGRRLAAAVRPGDTVARFGGDEFLVLCERLASTEEATEVAQRLLDAIGRPVGGRTGKVAISASVGIAVASGISETATGLVDSADQAMYRAKRAGSRIARAGDSRAQPSEVSERHPRRETPGGHHFDSRPL